MTKETVGLVIPVASDVTTSVKNANRSSAGSVLSALDKINGKSDADIIARLEGQVAVMRREIDSLIVFAETASKAIAALEKTHG
jgi:hypothetical protein